jgi:hypothetical protein
MENKKLYLNTLTYLIFKAAYFAIILLSCIARYLKGFLIDITWSTIIVLPITIFLWKVGFENFPYRKTILVIGIVLIVWPVLYLIILMAIAIRHGGIP